VRDTAQRLLVESPAADAAPPVSEILQSGKAEPLARLHALWTLDGLASLTPELQRAAFRDPAARVRTAAVRIAGREFAPELIGLVDEKDALVRAHLAIKLSALAMPEADAAMAKLLVSGGGAPPLVREAALTGLRGREAAFGTLLASQPGAQQCAPLFETMGVVVSTANKGRGFDGLLALAAAPATAPAIQMAIAKGLSTQANPKQPKLAWLDGEPPAMGPLRQALTAAKQEKLLAALDARIAWPGKPGAPAPPKIVPLNAEQTARFERGRATYTTLCAACHQPHGFGLDGLAPPLVDSEWVLGKADVSARIILHGLAGPVKVGARTWTLAMPPLGVLPDEDIAGVLTYIRREWEHGASPVEPAEIAALRVKYKDRLLPWTAADLKPSK
jgi:mono/diheme cytochrome c family protein